MFDPELNGGSMEERRLKAIESQVRLQTWFIIGLVIVVGILCVKQSFSAEMGMTPAMAVDIAWRDARRFVDDAPHTTYFLNWFGMNDFKDELSEEELGGFSYSLNLVPSTRSTAEMLVLPVDKYGFVVKVNWKRVWPDENDYRRGRLLLESLASKNFYFNSIDPHFFTNEDGVTVAPDVAKLHGIQREFPPFTFTDGKKYSQRFFAKFVPALHVAGVLEKSNWKYRELCKLCGTDNPLMVMDQFISFSHRSTTDGLYYFLVDMPETEDEADAQAGANFKLAAELRRDQRSVMWRRRLNARASLFEWASAQNRVTEGVAPVLKTRDFFARKVEARRHPIQNILGREHDASETFHPKANNLYKMGLWNGKGKRQNVAPGGIALDDSVSPCVEVEAGLCFRCHGPNKFIQPIENHLLAMTNVPVKIDGFLEKSLQDKFRILGIVGDKSKPHDPLEDVLDRAAGLFEGKPEDMIWQVRLTQVKATTKATGGYFKLDPVTQACFQLGHQFDRYELQPITPLTATRELGIICEDNDEAAKVLNDLALQIYPDTYGVSPESPALWALITWSGNELALPDRQSWENEYATLALRVTNALRSGTLKVERPKGDHPMAPYFDQYLSLAP